MIEKTRSATHSEFPHTHVTGYATGPACMMEDLYDDHQSDPTSVSTLLDPDGGSHIVYENGYGRFNACHHDHDRLDIDTQLCSAPYAICYERPFNGLHYTSTWNGAPTPTFPATPEVHEVTGEMRRRAWAGMYPEINEGLALSVSIAEFYDLKRLWISALKLRNLLLPTYKWGRSRATAGKSLADMCLAYNFGIKPIISDIEGIVNQLMKLKKLTNKFLNEGRQVKSYHYFEELTAEESWESTMHCRIRSQVKATYFATCKFSYDWEVPPFWKRLLRVGGLRITPGIVWDIIPYSFVVDWVLGIQAFLDQFDQDPTVTVYVHDYCDTIKSVTSTSAYRCSASKFPDAYTPSDPFPGMTVLGSYHGSQPVDDIENPLWTWERVLYDRVPGKPDMGVALPVFDMPSNRQLVLAGALLRARFN